MDVTVSINAGRIPAGRDMGFWIGQWAIFNYVISNKNILIGCLVLLFSSFEAEQNYENRIEIKKVIFI